MKKTIGIIITIGIMLVCAYLLGTTQAETITEIQTVIETKEIVPDGYVPLEQCIPLEDIGGYFINNNDYVCFELKDVENQLDNTNNKTYVDIIESLESITEGY